MTHPQTRETDPKVVSQGRVHLFINYATEDWEFVQWLALRLTAEGYAVWCDRLKLLGGESYPEDIDRAIREGTFRFLAVISQNSVHKANPRKERTLALNLARERDLDFVLPLNLGGVGPTDLGWMLSDLTYVPFDRSWADGLAQLLQKLQSISAPRTLIDGKGAVGDWLKSRDSLSGGPERVWTNVLPVEEIPESLIRARAAGGQEAGFPEGWPVVRLGERVFWSFELPDSVVPQKLSEHELVRWDEPYWRGGEHPSHIATQLLRKHLESKAQALGLERTPDGKHLYFPPGLLSGDVLSFESYNGRRSWVRAVGTRTFRFGMDREQSRYHLSPVFRPVLHRYGQPSVLVHVRLFLSDLDGSALDSRKAARRRKAIGRGWWNHQWLSRTLAVTQWLAAGEASISLGLDPRTKLTLAAQPLHLSAPSGIDEARLGKAPETEDQEDHELDEALVGLESSDDDW